MLAQPSFTPSAALPTLPALLRWFWRENKGMSLLFYANVGFVVMGLVGLAVDPRLILGQPAWAKLTKFALSLLIYAPTMIWTFSYVKINPRWKAGFLNFSAAILVLEMVLIAFQAVRGEPMHFNNSTDFNAQLFQFMGLTITMLYLANIGAFILLLRQPLTDRILAWGLRLGIVLMLVGFGLGYLMTNPTPDQMAELQAGGRPTMIGAHTVGAPDGGAGISFLGWSTTNGDLRIAHFVGIHGAQVLAFAGWWLSRQKQWREGQRLALVGGAGVGYGGAVALVTWQALRGEAFTSPSLLTIGVAAVLGLAAVAYTALVLRRR